MCSRNHFLGPHFSFTKALVRSLMGGGNTFVGLFKEKEQKIQKLSLLSQCHRSYANDNVDKATCFTILRQKWEETKCMQDICWNGCIVSLKKYAWIFNDWLVRIQSAHLNFLFKSLAYCLILMRICVYYTYISIVFHTKHISFFFCCRMKLHQSITYQEKKDWLEWFSRWEIWNIFLLLPMLKSAVSNNCS